MTTQVSEGIQILDDGEYYIELNVNFPAADAPGFLQRRCYVGVTTPGGYECVGKLPTRRSGHVAGVDRRPIRSGDRRGQPRPRPAPQPARRDRRALVGAARRVLPAPRVALAGSSARAAVVRAGRALCCV